MSKSIIEDLFVRGEARIDRIELKGEEYQKNLEEADFKQKLFLSGLSTEQGKQFQELMEIDHKLTNAYIVETYRHGVALGIKMVVEAFSIDN